MARKLTEKTLIRRVKLLAEAKGKSIAEKIWELVSNGLKKEERRGEERLRGKEKLISANLGQVKITDREELYDEILADRL